MLIDQTRLKSWWNNPEKYRLTYELNLVPKATAYGLSRGIAMHTIAELRHQGQTREQIDAVLVEKQCGPKPIAVAWQMADELERKYAGSAIRTVAVEQEFVFPIPGSPHSMAGRIDEILERDGVLWCGELKSANGKAQYDRKVEEWKHDIQADFEIIGARSLGHQVAGVFVRTITETAPPKIWEIEARRSEHQLNVTQLKVHQTCETILMYRAAFGIDKPWPHLASQWPCSNETKCEYEGICQQSLTQLAPDQLSGFKPRVEHLSCIAQRGQL